MFGTDNMNRCECLKPHTSVGPLTVDAGRTLAAPPATVRIVFALKTETGALVRTVCPFLCFDKPAQFRGSLYRLARN
jgi:hypothetical protein